MPPEADFRPETTFSSFDEEQSKAYAQIRRDYHPSVYQTIIDHHRVTGGQFGLVVDVGCGPGNSTRGLAASFAHAVGLDHSAGMIAVSRSFGRVTARAGAAVAGAEPIRFEVGTAEELGATLDPPAAVPGEVDLITAANAAHWFDMARFWRQAALLLRPGGSVALWTSGDIRVHPDTPNAAAIQAAIDQHRQEHLAVHYEPGNLLTRNSYADLALPWTLPEPVMEFDQDAFWTQSWDVNHPFFVGDMDGDLDMLEKAMATASPQVRWHQAHPDRVGTERDVLKILRKEIERLLHEVGVEEGKERIRGAVNGKLLMMKKKL